MPRKKTASVAEDRQTEESAVQANPAARSPITEPAASTAYASDPLPVVSVALSDHQGGPSAHLLRSHRFRQMQIRFDGEYPDERHLAKLAQAGWKNRTETEGVWIKQIDAEARWQSVRRMEQEFKAIVNDIRKEKGLSSALEGMAAG